MSNCEAQQNISQLFACLNQFLLLVGLISATIMNPPHPFRKTYCNTEIRGHNICALNSRCYCWSVRNSCCYCSLFETENGLLSIK
jgi:hypothetical protein